MQDAAQSSARPQKSRGARSIGQAILLWVIFGGTGRSAARQVNLNKRTFTPPAESSPLKSKMMSCGSEAADHGNESRINSSAGSDHYAVWRDC